MDKRSALLTLSLRRTLAAAGPCFILTLGACADRTAPPREAFAELYAESLAEWSGDCGGSTTTAAEVTAFFTKETSCPYDATAGGDCLGALDDMNGCADFHAGTWMAACTKAFSCPVPSLPAAKPRPLHRWRHLDVNSDGLPDLPLRACDAGGGAAALVLLGGADGLDFARHVSKGVEPYGCTGPWRLRRVGDIDGDGADDLAVSDETALEPLEPGVLLRFGPGAPATRELLQIAGSKDNATTVWRRGDTDGDGFDDIGLQRAGRVRIMRGSAKGLVGIDVPPVQADEDAFGFAKGPLGEAQGDFNGDGVGDLAFRKSSKGMGFAIWHGVKGGAEVEGPGFACESKLHFPAFGDFDGDGVDDAWCEPPDNGAGTPWFRGGPEGLEEVEATATAATNQWFPGSSCESAGWSRAGDLNGDGIDDLITDSDEPLLNGGNVATQTVVESSHAGTTHRRQCVAILYGRPTGPGRQPEQFVLAPTALVPNNQDHFWGKAWYPVGDVDGDGYDDIVTRVWHKAANKQELLLYRGSAKGLLPTPAVVPGGEAWDWSGTFAW